MKTLVTKSNHNGAQGVLVGCVPTSCNHRGADCFFPFHFASAPVIWLALWRNKE
ncbi:hypothetical protein BDZ91DRAFT_723360 [Kalaharituber pfeilii]|nr:hypothetical protein BDZ91DRAFT_723360 [Kalaharituber pfeilii]